MNMVKNQLTGEYGEVPATARYYKVGVSTLLQWRSSKSTQDLFYFPSGSGGAVGGGGGPELWGRQ